MAFGRAAGHNNLPSGNFTPEIFSQKVLKFFRRASVAEDITNTDYAGEIENLAIRFASLKNRPSLYRATLVVRL